MTHLYTYFVHNTYYEHYEHIYNDYFAVDIIQIKPY